MYFTLAFSNSISSAVTFIKLNFSDDQNYVYFHDVLFKMIKHEYGRNVEKTNKLILKEEEKFVGAELACDLINKLQAEGVN